MNLPGYDAWKTREPDLDADKVCDRCGDPLCRQRLRGHTFWVCERCDPEPEWEAGCDE